MSRKSKKKVTKKKEAKKQPEVVVKPMTALKKLKARFK